MSVPAGRSAAGRPVGLQLIGRRFEDAKVLAVARAHEQISPWAHWYREVWR
jgi:Asp-tRNA(Asn)/Glu-tRNA(Gln) amidotransferase A subunit family amidase